MIFPIWVNSKQRGAGQSRCLQVTALCPGTLSSSLEILIVIITIKVPSSFSPSQYHHRSHHCIHYHDQSPNIYTSILLLVIGYHSQSFQCCTSWETSWTPKVSLCAKKYYDMTLSAEATSCFADTCCSLLPRTQDQAFPVFLPSLPFYGIIISLFSKYQ